MNILYISPFLEHYSYSKNPIGSKLKNIISHLSRKNIIDVILPLKNISEKHIRGQQAESADEFSIGGQTVSFKVYRLKSRGRIASVYCLEINDRMLNPELMIEEKIRDGILFSIASARFIIKSKRKYDAVHSIGWSTYLFPMFYRLNANDYDTPLVHAVDNIDKQLILDRQWLTFLGLPTELYNIDYLEYYGHINLLKGATIFSDIILLNSKATLKNILNNNEPSLLGRFFHDNHNKMKAINDGINARKWKPSSDSYIYRKFDRNSLGKKRLNKRMFQRLHKFEVNDNIPMIGIIIDFFDNDYIDLLQSVLNRLLVHPVQCVICAIEDQYMFRKLSALSSPKNDNLYIHYGLDIRLQHQLYASSDIFILTPHKSKATTNHIKSLAYGSIPVVNNAYYFLNHITDIQSSQNEGNGYLLTEYSSDALFSTIIKSIKDFRDRGHWNQIIKRAMSEDNSYKKLVLELESIYSGLVRG